MDNNKYFLPKKSNLRKLTTTDIKIDLPDLKNAEESKAITIANWLASWIKSDLEKGVINYSDIIPSKSEFAYLLGVSIGTMQHAVRFLEDLGIVESKQCIGTMIKNPDSEQKTIRKLTSKRDLAIASIKRYILSDGFAVGEYLPSAKTIATIIGYTSNVTRLAIDALVAEGIIEKNFKNPKENGWKILTLDFEDSTQTNHEKSKTLVDIVVKDIENLIAKELKIGDKMYSHIELTKKLNASLKTVHDALQIVANKGYLLTRRGQYGTSVIKIPGAKNDSRDRFEDSIFASAKDTAFYHYEKTQNYIKKLIATEYNIGDKLPSIKALSETLDLSQNTIRTAFQNLAKEGYLVFSRGRYGGTFVIDIPEIETQSFKWLAVNPTYAKNYQNIDSN